MGDLENHVGRDCGSVSVLCVFNTVGCEVELPRRDLPTHLKKEINSHVKLLRLHTEENLPLFARCLELVLAENEELRSAVSKLASECQRLASESQNLHRDLRNLKSKHENLQCCVQQQRKEQADALESRDKVNSRHWVEWQHKFQNSLLGLAAVSLQTFLKIVAFLLHGN